ncbi:MAG: acyltransferase, partial [Pseudomonadota bacterium]
CLALFAVIVVHTSQDFSSALYPFLPYTLVQFDPYHLGRYGVQLFFAISGFTMVMMYRSYQEKWRDPVKVFYVKRILRLYPLLVISAFIYAGIELRADARFNPDGVDMMDFVRLLSFTGGWDPHYLNVLVPGVWSIINEIYFYMLFPLIFLMLGRVNPWLVGTVIAALNVGLVLGAQTLYAGGDDWLIRDFMYRNFLVSLLCFYAGIEAYRFLNEHSKDFFALATPLLLVGVAMEVVERQTGLGITSEILKVTVLACLAYGLIILAFHPSVARWFQNGVIEKFGTVTYTGYILHFGIIHFAHMAAVQAGLIEQLPFELVLPFIVVATALISYGIQHWTENVWQDLANTLCRNWFTRKPASESPGAAVQKPAIRPAPNAMAEPKPRGL